MAVKKTLTKEQILAALREHRDALDRFSVKRIALFGSYAEGTQKRNSDIDFVVEFEDPSLENFMGLIDFLEELFTRKVEVLTPEGVRSIRIKEVAESIRRQLVYA
ncbi:MAG: nucleotidyltransferase domain-containing protein [Nitrospinota bacterium]